MHYENRHKPKNIPYTLAYRYRKDVAQNEPILIAPSAAVGESHTVLRRHRQQWLAKQQC